MSSDGKTNAVSLRVNKTVVCDGERHRGILRCETWIQNSERLLRKS